jgi:uncharacterized protein YeaO (DUF488 family)
MSAAETAATRSRGLAVKRVYEPAAAGDGLRVLVDRLWPRGISKNEARIDLWLKAIAPSDALRRRVHDGKLSWSGFTAAYRRELAQEPAKSATAELRELFRRQRVTLLYGSRDEINNNAVALKRWLERSGRAPRSAAHNSR